MFGFRFGTHFLLLPLPLPRKPTGYFSVVNPQAIFQSWILVRYADDSGWLYVPALTEPELAGNCVKLQRSWEETRLESGERLPSMMLGPPSTCAWPELTSSLNWCDVFSDGEISQCTDRLFLRSWTKLRPSIPNSQPTTKNILFNKPAFQQESVSLDPQW